MNAAVFDLPRWSAGELARIEQALSDWVAADSAVDAEHPAPAALREGMRYAVLDGGKRLRPLLVLAAREAVATGEPASAAAGLNDAALRAACAVELIHA